MKTNLLLIAGLTFLIARTGYFGAAEDGIEHNAPSPESAYNNQRYVGQTDAARQRNAALLGEYDYSKYVTALTGYTGLDRQRVAVVDYQNAVRTRVGRRGNYKAGLARQSDGTLLTAVCRRNTATGLFFILVYESKDEGLTWHEIGQSRLFGKEPSLAALPNGTIVLVAQDQDPANLGKEPVKPVSRSVDGGRTWETSTMSGPSYPRNLFVEEDGSLLMIRALRSGWSFPNDGSPNLMLCRSKDGAKTWETSEGIVDWDQTEFDEVAVIRLRDDRLLAALRRQIPGTDGEGFEDTVLTESTDDGKHWCRPWRFGNTAEVQVYLTELRDGRILATYSNYHLPWGVCAVISRDSGRTWDLNRPVQLALSAEYYVGWAVTLQLPDDSLITSYAATTYLKQPPETTTCEIVRWNLPSDPN